MVYVLLMLYAFLVAFLIAFFKWVGFAVAVIGTGVFYYAAIKDIQRRKRGEPR